jgi:predicted secreted acid phosphatase
MTPSYAAEPDNLGQLRDKLIQYHDSGNYSKDQQIAIAAATDYLKQRLVERKKQSSAKPLAIVMDIDETVLTDYPYLLKMRFGGRLKNLCDAEGQGENPVIQPSLAFYQFAKANDVAVFFITGRNEKYKAGSTKNLKNVGFKDWDGLFMVSSNDNHALMKSFKVVTREKIEKRGYDIILNIGDQPSDLAGGHADKTIKMPNPYYFTG